jgi:SSS family solute:Na+ symporter
MHLAPLDVLIFLGYFLGVIAFAVIVAWRSKTRGSAADYFLASKKLPWYAVGASFVASNISTEHFIGMVGWGFLYGMAVANWEWGNAITFTALIWIFLPFYMRSNVTTMPEFLERRFNPACRTIYAAVMLVGLVIAMLGGVMFAGAKALNVFFPQIPMAAGIVLLALAAGIYTVYGGLLSAVWADFLQYCLLMIGGLAVTIFGLHYAGGLGELMRSLPEKFIVFHPSTHETIPWSGLVTGLLSVGIWYNCANQFMIQRCLGARSEWDARMGVVMAGFSKAFLPFIVVVPGIIAFHLFSDRLSDGDQAWPFMVREFLPAGITGLVLAGLASAILSTLSAITNSSSTIFTLDLYRPLLRSKALDHELHLVGRLSAVVILLVGVGVGLLIAAMPGITVFGLIQQTFFYMAAPIAACFLIGILWRGATPAGAVITMITGFVVFTPLTRFVLFPKIPALTPYDNFMHHTFAVLVLSGITLVVVSRFTKRKSDEELRGVVWTRAALQSSADEAVKRPAWQSLKLWWGLMFLSIVGLCAGTALFGSHSKVIEAEAAAFEINGGTTEVRPRGTLKDFNLWTGTGELLFRPDAAGSSITFKLPTGRSGTRDVAIVVTRGADYGQFRAELNGQPAEIRWYEAGADSIRPVRREARVFPPPLEGTRHVVGRADLGSVPSGGPVTVRLISENGAPIGIDSLVLTRH